MKYNEKLNLDDKNNSLAILIGRIKPHSTVLEFGPANGSMTQYLREELDCRVYAVEIDSEAAKDAAKFAEKILVGNIEEYGWREEFKGVLFDTIIFADVLEHLYDPEKVLKSVRDFLSEEGCILASIPNIAHNAIVLDLLKNEFNYHPTGLLDDTHIRFFTKKTFDQLVERAGYFRSYETATFKTPENTEFGNSYNDLPENVAHYLKDLPYGEMYQLVYEIKKHDSVLESSFSSEEKIHSKNYAQLYIDYGNGISEKDSIKLDIKEKVAVQEFVFDLAGMSDINALRFDPINNSCVVEIEKVLLLQNDQSEIDLMNHLETNACYRDGKSYFFTFDPQVTIKNISKKVCKNSSKLLCVIHYIQTDKEALSSIVLKNDTQLSEKKAQISEKEHQLHTMNQQIAALHQLAYSLTIKGRIKRILKFLLPLRIQHLLKDLIKTTPPFKRVEYVYTIPILTNSIKKEMEDFESKPMMSILMPVYNVDPKWLDLAIKSIENQWYDHWELCIADDKSTNEETLHYLHSIKNPKIKIHYLEENLNISGASNQALAIAEGEYVVLMDNDDEITVDALYEAVKAINATGAEFVYSDEDKLEMNGQATQPHFKADFAPDMILSQNYMSHLGVIKKELVDKVGGFALGLEGAQDYDLYLKVLEHTDKIHHIQKVLYHWRKIPGSTAATFSNKSYANDAGVTAIKHALKRRNIDADVLTTEHPGNYRVKYALLDAPLVSIIVPFKDKPELLRMCIESILDKSTYKNFEIIGISNNSREDATFAEMKRLEDLDSRIQFYDYNVPFNYSAINNHAVRTYAKGEQIILLNNDIEIITPEWIESMLEHSQRSGVGCVGAKLYYPNDLIQHAGVIIGVGGVANHSHKYFEKQSPGYFNRLNILQNLSAVTAACFMVKKSIFKELNGLDEKNLAVAFNDVDFCLRVREEGYLNVYTPYCEAYHHESISRGVEDTQEKQERFTREVEFMQNRHKTILDNGDPYYNVNLTLDREDFGLKELKGL